MSKMAIAYACLYGFRADVDAPPRASGRPALIGNGTHWKVADVLGAHVKKPDLSDTIWAEANAIYDGPLRGWLAARTWTVCEAGLAYDASKDVCEDGPRRGEPGYDDCGPMLLRGTLDLVLVEPERIVLRDLKTGKPPEDREQLYAQAVAASRRWKRDVVEIGYVRALKTKVEELDLETLDADRLDEEAGRIAGALRRLPMSKPVPGDRYCWKCDARSSCPAFGAAAAEAKEKDLEAAGFFS